MTAQRYQLVRLKNGTHSVQSLAHGETFHPVIGPAAEAEALHVRQLRLPQRLARHNGEFLIWDVGLGAAANAVVVLRAARQADTPIRLWSFDHSLEPLRFALRHVDALPYLADYRSVLERLASAEATTACRFDNGAGQVDWSVVLGDFPSLVANWATSCPAANASTATPPAPHAILYDPFSPAKNPAMWTLPLFTAIYRRLEPCRPCALATYSRSTMLRVTLLLAGFFVGIGHATGEKEETTVAANTLALIDEPLQSDWLARVRRSTSAEPLQEPAYRQRPLRPESYEQLLGHPQFNA